MPQWIPTTLLALGVCFDVAPDTKRSGRAVTKSDRKQPTLKGYNWTMSAVQCDNVRKVKCRPLRNRGCKLEHPLTVFIGEGIGLLNRIPFPLCDGCSAPDYIWNPFLSAVAEPAIGK